MRKEVKFKISYKEYINIQQIMDRILCRDKHSKEDGTYLIRNMYFDNYLKQIENQKKMDINAIKKYRIRMYNKDASAIFLERKTNVNDFIDKKSKLITKQKVIDIINRRLQQNRNK